MIINLSKNKNATQIIQCLKKYTSLEFQKDPEVMGLVYESHFLDISESVLETLQKIEIPAGTYVFVLCISKGIQGNSLSSVARILQKKGIEIQYIEHIILAENLSGEASFVGEKKSVEAEQKIEKISKELEARKIKKVERKASIFYNLLAKMLRLPVLYSFLSKTFDENRCNKCGYCRGVCPTQKKLQKVE